MNTYIARQSIFNRNRKVVFYELLFRSNSTNAYSALDGDFATFNVISNTFLSIGLDKITGDKRAFINFTANHILNDVPTILPKNSIGVELLEDILPTKKIVEKCRELKSQGYLLILDDFVFRNDYSSLICLADIIKVDFSVVKGASRKEILTLYGDSSTKFLAEKVESEEDYLDAINYGYDYLQGYYFSKPEVLSKEDIPMSWNFKYSLLKLLFSDSSSVEDMESMIKRDLSLSYKLLILANSAHFAISRNITSIKDAIMIIGVETLKKWIFMLMIDKNPSSIVDDYLYASVVKSKFGEILTQKLGLPHLSEKIFLLEMLTGVHKVLNKPMDTVLRDLSIDKEIEDALVIGTNNLAIIHEILQSYETQNWHKFNLYLKLFNVHDLDCSSIYLEAMQWAKELIA